MESSEVADQFVDGPIKTTEEKLWTTEANGSVQLRIDALCPQSPITVHQMFLESVDKYGPLDALSTKRNGIWEHVTFMDYYKLCRQAAKSFLKDGSTHSWIGAHTAGWEHIQQDGKHTQQDGKHTQQDGSAHSRMLGLERFHSVGILGFNSEEWFISAIGTVFAGGIITGIYTTNSPEACHYVASDCKMNIIVVENQKQLEKILQIWDGLPHLKAVVQYKGNLQEKRPNLYTWEEFMEFGKDIADAHLDDIINSQKANQCCVLIYTSGTTGNPKGVMLSHDNVWGIKILPEWPRITS
uniref:Long-chain-fatty-acid--CoA ligase ACSBG1 n=1 Tax=Xenopus tropicalis TaxID=8364 RepID=A0A6I8RHL1_XENTR